MARWGFNTGLDGHRVTPLDEHAAEEIADALGYIYEQANQRMLKNVADRLARGVTTYGWAERKAGEVGAAHRQLESDLAQARRDRISLLDGLAERCAMSGSQKFYQDIGGMLGNTAHISPNSQKAAYILADMNNTLNAAERRILRQFDDRYADVIGRVSSEFATGVMNTRQAVGDALRAFADQGISGFIDRGGHHWTLRDYSEMAVLTAIERATLSSYVDTMQSYGFDLAVIDGHAGSCPICTAWEGVIVSVSGEDHRYPSLGEAENEGVFHPRCVHGITTYYEGITHAPRGGFRDHPRAVQQPNTKYTARSQQRYMERQIRKYKDRLIVAQTQQQRQMAQNKIREWTRELDKLIDKQPASNYLYRHRDRETATSIHSTPMSSRRPTNWPSGDGGLSTAKLQQLSTYAKGKGIRLDLDSFKHFEGTSSTVEEVINALARVADDFPLLRDKRRGIILHNSYTMNDNDYAQVIGKNIMINNNAFRNHSALEENYRSKAADRWFVEGTTSASIGYHESGHLVVNIYQLPLWVTDGINPDSLSEYASQSKQEQIAESFNAHYSGIRNESALTIVSKCAKIAQERGINNVD